MKPCRCPLEISLCVSRDGLDLDVLIHGSPDAGDMSVGVPAGAIVEHVVEPEGFELTPSEEQEAVERLVRQAEYDAEARYDDEMESRWESREDR